MSNIELTPAERTELLRRLVAGELPDSRGRFGPFGGRYAPETLITALERLAEGVQRYLRDVRFTLIGGGTSEILKLIIAKEISA